MGGRGELSCVLLRVIEATAADVPHLLRRALSPTYFRSWVDATFPDLYRPAVGCRCQVLVGSVPKITTARFP